MHIVDAKLCLGILFRDAKLLARHVLDGANRRRLNLEHDGAQVPARVVRVHNPVLHRQAATVYGDRFVPTHRLRTPPSRLVFVARAQRFGGCIRLCGHEAQKFEWLCGIGRRVDAHARALGAYRVDVELRTDRNDRAHRRVLMEQHARWVYKHVHGGRCALGKWLYLEARFGIEDFVLAHGDAKRRAGIAVGWVHVHATRGARERAQRKKRERATARRHEVHFYVLFTSYLLF